ncbi:MAG: hypothetical protein U0694_21200 [Anaerolineae bacterium]
MVPLQPGASCAGWPPTLLIELNGAGAGLAHGLDFTSGSNTVRGLIINRFGQFGMHFTSGGSNIIQCNFIGTDTTGTVDLGNGNYGIRFDNSANNTIGGGTPGVRNLISANGGAGLALVGGTSTGNIVQGNYIGTNVNGTAALGNSGAGLDIGGANSNIFGGTPAQRNIISANTLGISLSAGASNNTVQGNYIGTDVNGTANLGNINDGIRIDGSNNLVGSISGSDPNTISFNTGNGVRIVSGSGNHIVSNSIHSNGALGIDIDPVGVTANDMGDGDTGVNDLQNYPVILTASPTLVQFTLNGPPNTAYRVEVFSSSTCDPSGFGEGQTSLAVFSITTDATGNAPNDMFGTFTLGQFITAIVTQPNNSTSEFSWCLQVTGEVGTERFSLIPIPCSPSPRTLALLPSLWNWS